MAPMLEPYVTLTRGLGLFFAQAVSVRPRTIEIECAGDAAALPPCPIVNSALAGVLGSFCDVPLNAVNAPLLAKDGGIEVRDQRTSEAGSFATLVTLTLVSS